MYCKHFLRKINRFVVLGKKNPQGNGSLRVGNPLPKKDCMKQSLVSNEELDCDVKLSVDMGINVCSL